MTQSIGSNDIEEVRNRIKLAHARLRDIRLAINKVDDELVALDEHAKKLRNEFRALEAAITLGFESQAAKEIFEKGDSVWKHRYR